jgi:hypothetical protein
MAGDGLDGFWGDPISSWSQLKDTFSHVYLHFLSSGVEWCPPLLPAPLKNECPIEASKAMNNESAMATLIE